eukprot:557778-Rhodomonas_salina.2
MKERFVEEKDKEETGAWKCLHTPDLGHNPALDGPRHAGEEVLSETRRGELEEEPRERGRGAEARVEQARGERSRTVFAEHDGAEGLGCHGRDVGETIAAWVSFLYVFECALVTEACDCCRSVLGLSLQIGDQLLTLSRQRNFWCRHDCFAAHLEGHYARPSCPDVVD